MDLVTAQSEEKLLTLLASMRKNPVRWVLHVRMAEFNALMLEQESLSRHTLAKIEGTSRQIAQILDGSLRNLGGRIFLFEDGDILALFEKEDASCEEALARLHKEFAAQELLPLLSIEEISGSEDSLLQLARAKSRSAAIFRHKRRAVETAETIFRWTETDKGLAHILHQKRRQHEKGHILVVEDDRVASGLVTLFLRDQFTVAWAKDAVGAITAYVDDAPDVVLLDIHLAGHDGREILDHLKLLDPDAYVLMFSGDTAMPTVLSAREHGAAGFIRKPFSREKIVSHVRQCPTLLARKAV